VSLLVGGSLLAWLLAAAGAFLLGGGLDAVLLAATALGICLVPALVTLVVIEKVSVKHPEMLGILTLAGTAIRIAAVGAAAVLLNWQVEFFRKDTWYIWVVVFYLVTLALETAAIVTGRVPPPTA
jgi:hypothetical protein